MKYLVITVIAVLTLTDPLRISKINTAKKEAREAFTSGDYKTAIAKYRYLIDSLDVSEDEVKLNLANAYFLSKDTVYTEPLYNELITSNASNEIKSVASQQLGVMANQAGKPEDALSHFKYAVKTDPLNEEARYNYEMVKKKLDDQKKKDEQNKDQNKDQKDENKDQQNKEQKNQDEQQKKEQEEKQKEEQRKKEEEQKKQEEEKEQKDKADQKKQDEEKSKDEKEKESKEDQKKDQEKNDNPNEQQPQDKISEEKARMILEAMRNQEKQYLQQQKRKSTKPKDKGKPDW